MRHPVDPNSYDASDPFGSMSGGRSYPHTGSDYGVAYAEVYAPCDGVIYHVGFNSGNGNYVTMYLTGHDWDGVAGGAYMAFIHLSSTNVSEGQAVKQGQKIGVSGNSGTNSRGPHLHITLSNSDLAHLGIGDKVDPYAYIEARPDRPTVVPSAVVPQKLTEKQKLQLQRKALEKQIRDLRKQKKLDSAKGRNLTARLKRLILKIRGIK